MENKEINYDKYSLGVIIGRFQCSYLHEAHTDLIDRVVKNHHSVAIFLGIPAITGTKKNPLDFDSRKRMIQSKYPNVMICPLPDMRYNDIWVKNLEFQIRLICPIGQPLLYGGRDSFISIYKENGGVYDTTELEQTIYVSATEIRKNASKEIINEPAFRAGKIHSIYNTYPRINMCVDIAPFKDNETKLLLARKPGELKYRFIGGHVDLEDESLEMAAKREFFEETGKNCEIDGLEYVASANIDDWRVRGLDDVKYKSVLFKGTFIFGMPNPSDDICELRFFQTADFYIDKFIEETIVEEHVYFMKKLMEQHKKKYETKTIVNNIVEKLGL